MKNKFTVNISKWLYVMLLFTCSMLAKASPYLDVNGGDVRLGSFGIISLKDTKNSNLPAALTFSAPATFTLTNSGQNTSSGYITRYVLVNNATNQILYANSSPSFNNIPVGSYLAYAVNYDGTQATPNLSIGTNINAIGGTCSAISIALPITVTSAVCTPVVTGGTMTAVVSGNNTSAGYVTVFVMTDGSGVIQSSNSVGSFTAPSTPGTYNIYAVNYTGTPPAITVGTNISSVSGSCVSVSAPKCFTATTPLPVVVANPDIATTVTNTPVATNVLNNDTYNAAQASTSVVTVTPTQPSNGSVSVTNGVITYTPNAGYSGPDSYMRYANLAARLIVKDFIKFFETKDDFLTLSLGSRFDFFSRQI